LAASEPDPPAIHAGKVGLVRVRLDIAYDGTDFSGWAAQPSRRTVQSVLEAALTTILRERVTLTVAGRTDAGVHASGQVAHLDVTEPAWAELGSSLRHRLAGLLPPDLRVRAVTATTPDFDARHAALWRRYVYRATDDAAAADPLRRRDTLAWSRPLDVSAMSHAAAALLGIRDFAAFCRRREGTTSIRTLQRLDVERVGRVIEWQVQADAFCYSMVRSLVGALLAVGDGRRDRTWLGSKLALSVRADDITVAPAHGLTLVEVGYPPDDDLAGRARVTRQRRR
jgi:tRNA pseudouridine38-40 synthase